LSKSFFSALFTLMLTLVVQLLFFSRKRGIWWETSAQPSSF
jgi:hypothetical protein